MEKKIISLEKLLQTPVCYMSGEELAFLFNNLGVLDKDKKPKSSMPHLTESWLMVSKELLRPLAVASQQPIVLRKVV